MNWGLWMVGYWYEFAPFKSQVGLKVIDEIARTGAENRKRELGQVSAHRIDSL